MRIRVARQEDGDALAELRRQAEQTHARLLPDYFRAPPRSRFAVPSAGPTAATSSSVALLAEGQGAGLRSVLGYVTVRVVDTPPDPTMTPRRRAYVDTIVVEERHRGSGIGTALMRAAASWARRRDVAEVVLTVWSENRAAEALYRRLGYQPIARVLRCNLDSS